MLNTYVNSYYINVLPQVSVNWFTIITDPIKRHDVEIYFVIKVTEMYEILFRTEDSKCTLRRRRHYN